MLLDIISDDNFIDTDNIENIEKYKSNLLYLISKIKENGYLDRFVIIRNDDFFPQDYVWRINTEGEYRTLFYYSKVTPRKFSFFKSNKEYSEPIKVELYHPVHFRSTKHFTVNTPLGLTSEYNAVKTNRMFTIIDDMQNFLESGYGYSLSDRDAYLDITHEGLKISEKAMILISYENYLSIKNNQELMNVISRRKLIVYKGNLSLAINMVLTENGILPIRNGIYDYDEDLKSIIRLSLEEICKKYNLEYDRPHGCNGHFTSIIDQYYYDDTVEEFIQYLNSRFEQKLDEKQIRIRGNIAWQEYLDIVGESNFINAVETFNQVKKEEIKRKKENYLKERKITTENSSLFKETIQLIRKYEKSISFQDEKEIQCIIDFFLATSLKKQIESAVKIKEFLQEKVENKGPLK